METVWLDAKTSNMCGASIGSGGKGMSRACEISAVGSCSEASGWEFESVPYAGILTSASFAQSELERWSGLPFTHKFELKV